MSSPPNLIGQGLPPEHVSWSGRVAVCCVSQCQADQSEPSAAGITFHRFPRHPGLQQLWVDFLNHELFRPPKSSRSRLCSRHFHPDQFLPPPNGPSTGPRRLRKCAIPLYLSGYDPGQAAHRQGQALAAANAAYAACRRASDKRWPLGQTAAADRPAPPWDHRYARETPDPSPEQEEDQLNRAIRATQEDVAALAAALEEQKKQTRHYRARFVRANHLLKTS